MADRVRKVRYCYATTSARAGIFDADGKLLATARRPIALWREAGDIAEQSTEDIWQACAGAVREALANCRRPVLGIGIAAIGPVSTQRGTLLQPANFYGIHDVPIVRIVAEKQA